MYAQRAMKDSDSGLRERGVGEIGSWADPLCLIPHNEKSVLETSRKPMRKFPREARRGRAPHPAYACTPRFEQLLNELKIKIARFDINNTSIFIYHFIRKKTRRNFYTNL